MELNSRGWTRCVQVSSLRVEGDGFLWRAPRRWRGQSEARAAPCAAIRQRHALASRLAVVFRAVGVSRCCGVRHHVFLLLSPLVYLLWRAYLREAPAARGFARRRQLEKRPRHSFTTLHSKFPAPRRFTDSSATIASASIALKTIVKRGGNPHGKWGGC